MDDARLTLAFLTDGGAGNLFVQINFIYCVYGYLKEERPKITVFGHKSDELNRLLMEGAEFVADFFPPTESNRGYECDAFVHLEFFPDVLSEKPELKHKSKKAYELVQTWKEFMCDMQRRYGIMHPVVNYNAYIYAINNSKMVLDVYDVDGIIGVSKDYQWRIDIFGGEDYLASLGIVTDGYITVQRGATPGSFQKESTKLWPVRYYEKLIGLLKAVYPEKKVVQVGELGNSDQLCGVDVDLLGKTTWRQLGILLKSSWLHIDCECGMVHFRRMLTDKPSVVLFGPTPMEFYGYEGNINIHSNVYRNWCARLTNSWSERCMRGEEEPLCMKTLLPGAVLEKIVAWHNLSLVRDGRENEIVYKNEELYSEEGIRLDDTHKRGFLDQYKIVHYEKEKVEIGKLKVFCVREDGYSFVRLEETAAYRTLAGMCGWDDYEEYIRLLRKKDYNAIHSSGKFRELVRELDEKGYDRGCPILIDTNNRILDGQHRSAWLAARYGLSYQAEVVRIYRLGDESWDLFPFEKIEKGSRVIIYGCGAIGESYGRQIDVTGYCEVCGLLDRKKEAWNSDPVKRKWMECEDPSEITSFEGVYDYVVIASRGGKNMRDMKQFMLSKGVSEEKIVSYADGLE